MYKSGDYGYILHTHYIGVFVGKHPINKTNNVWAIYPTISDITKKIKSGTIKEFSTKDVVVGKKAIMELDIELDKLNIEKQSIEKMKNDILLFINNKTIVDEMKTGIDRICPIIDYFEKRLNGYVVPNEETKSLIISKGYRIYGLEMNDKERRELRRNLEILCKSKKELKKGISNFSKKSAYKKNQLNSLECKIRKIEEQIESLSELKEIFRKGVMK